jgi:ankyrin repeat protein
LLATITPVLLAASTFHLLLLHAINSSVTPPPSTLFRRKPDLMSGLLRYARDGDLANVQRLLASGAASFTESDSMGRTALHWGAWKGHLELVQWLLSAGGASITERDHSGWSALLWTAYGGHIELVQWLLSAGGASITERDHSGYSALLWAVQCGRLELLQWLLSAGGASITERDHSGNSALLLAAYCGHFACAQWLLEDGGASIYETNVDGRTVWSYILHEDMDAHAHALASLLKVMVLLADAPPDFVAELSPVHAELATRGRQLRAELPSYLEQQRALVVAHCSLPAALQPIVYGLAAPTPEDMWTYGLRVRAPLPKRQRAEREEAEGSVPLRQSVRLRQKRE